MSNQTKSSSLDKSISMYHFYFVEAILKEKPEEICIGDYFGHAEDCFVYSLQNHSVAFHDLFIEEKGVVLDIPQSDILFKYPKKIAKWFWAQIASQKAENFEYKLPPIESFKSMILNTFLGGQNSSLVLKESEDTYKAIGISTAHLSKECLDSLTVASLNQSNNMVLERDTGFFVKLYDDAECNLKMPLTYNVLHILKECYAAGFRLVEFDCDAKEYECLTVKQ